jgi:hypothetical protein
MTADESRDVGLQRTSEEQFNSLLDVVREEFGRVAYSQKTHQKMVDRLNRAFLWEKRIAAVLLALTTGNTIKGLLSDSQAAEVVALVFSSLALLLTVYGLSRNRERQIELHRHAAQSLWLIRERYVHLIGDLHAGSIGIEKGRARRDALTRAAAHVYSSAPDTDAGAYAAAQRALKVDDELTFSKREIDVMLPPAIRSKAM